jgi:ATP-dependent Clp protease ATP-binding subunit ClpB
VNFKNTLIIMTSNIGSPLLLEGISKSGHISESARRGVMDELQARFRPEFLNRIDDVVLFKPLTQAEMSAIVDLQLAELGRRLAGQRIGLAITEPARKALAKAAYDPVYGARPLKRYLQRHVETPAARLVVAGQVPEGGEIRVTANAAGELEVAAGGKS